MTVDEVRSGSRTHVRRRRSAVVTLTLVVALVLASAASASAASTRWSGWQLGPPLPAGVAVASSPAAATAFQSNLEHVAVLGTDGRVYVSTVQLPARTWSAWTPLPGGLTTSSAPALLADERGRIHVAVRDRVGVVHYQAWDAARGWQGWIPLPGVQTFDPPVVVYDDGTLTLLARGYDGIVQVNRGLSGWVPVPGSQQLTGSPAVATTRTGTLLVVGRAPGGRVVWTQRPPGGAFRPWAEVPGGALVQSSPAAVSIWDVGPALDAERQLVFVRGLDDQLWETSYLRGRWSGWSRVPGDGLTRSTPGAASDGIMRVGLYVQSIDGATVWRNEALVSYAP